MSSFILFSLEVLFRAILILDILNNILHIISFSSPMENYFLMVLSKFVLKYIFVKLQDLEKETEFNFFLGYPTYIK